MIKGHLDKRGMKPYNPKKIADAFELVCGQGKSINDAALELDIAPNSICGWLSRYWFYKKIDNPAIVVFKSKV
jgi:transposase-like protein